MGNLHQFQQHQDLPMSQLMFLPSPQRIGTPRDGSRCTGERQHALFNNTDSHEFAKEDAHTPDANKHAKIILDANISTFVQTTECACCLMVVMQLGTYLGE